MTSFVLWSITLIIFCCQGVAGLAATSAVNRATSVCEQPSAAPDLAMPVTISSNKDGTCTYRFAMEPVITNMLAASNDLVRLQAEAKEVQKQMADAMSGAKRMQGGLRSDYKDLFNVETNFLARNDEGKKLNTRILELEKELKQLKAELQKKMGEDDAYKAAKAGMQSKREEFVAYQRKIEELRKPCADAAAKVYQLQAVMEKAMKAEAEKANQTGPTNAGGKVTDVLSKP